MRWLAGIVAAAVIVLAASAQTDLHARTPQAAAADPENWREVAPDQLIVFDTSRGRFFVETLPEAAPAHAARYAEAIRSGMFSQSALPADSMGFAIGIGASIPRPEGFGDGASRAPEFTFRRDPDTTPLDVTFSAEGQGIFGLMHGFPIVSQADEMAWLSMDGRVESWVPIARAS